MIPESLTRSIIMSDPKQQRADGCSIFATLIVAGILISAFYFIQGIFEQDEPAPVSDEITKQRIEKIGLHDSEAEKFNNMIDSFHTESNSSIEAVMRKVIKEGYESNNTTAP